MKVNPLLTMVLGSDESIWYVLFASTEDDDHTRFEPEEHLLGWGVGGITLLCSLSSQIPYVKRKSFP